MRSLGQRAGLTHARVLAAARELLAESGFEALTMRSLALRLDVSPNALYSHVESKTALIADVLDGLLMMTEENWGDKREELAELLRSAVA